MKCAREIGVRRQDGIGKNIHNGFDIALPLAVIVWSTSVAILKTGDHKRLIADVVIGPSFPLP